MSGNKHYIGAGLIAVGLLLLWVLDVPAYGSINTLRQAIKDRKIVVQERRDTLANVQKLTAEYDTRKEDIQRFSAVIPATKSTAELVSALEVIADRAGIQLLEMSPNEAAPDPGDTSSKLSIQLKVRGSYNGLFGFLDGIEKNIRLINIDSIEAAGDQTQAGILNLTVRGTAYFVK